MELNLLQGEVQGRREEQEALELGYSDWSPKTSCTSITLEVSNAEGIRNESLVRNAEGQTY